MDVRNGRIYSMTETIEWPTAQWLREMKVPPSQKQLRRGRVGRNDPCPCGSGRKFKKCCLGKVPV